MRSRHGILKEVLFTWLVSIAIICMTRLYWPQYLRWVVPVTLIYLPLAMLRFKRVTIQSLGLQQGYGSAAWRLLFIVCLLLFPLFFLTAWLWQHGNMSLQPKLSHIGSVLWVQLLWVALPEEFFFRGYVQGRLQQHITRSYVFGLSQAGVISSILFTFTHVVVDFHWWSAFILFPSLGMAWLRDRTGGIYTSIVFHAVCNTAMWFVVT